VLAIDAISPDRASDLTGGGFNACYPDGAVIHVVGRSVRPNDRAPIPVIGPECLAASTTGITSELRPEGAPIKPMQNP
jgi:hypothetical protein